MLSQVNFLHCFWPVFWQVLPIGLLLTVLNPPPRILASYGFSGLFRAEDAV